MAFLKPHFLIIDDSKLDCFIAEKLIRNTNMSQSIRSFFRAKEALTFIENDETIDDGSKTILIVDIHMPLMDGFEFVEAFETLPQNIQSKYVIYVLTSSINKIDLNKVKNYSSIKSLLNKPLTSSSLASIIDLEYR